MNKIPPTIKAKWFRSTKESQKKHPLLQHHSNSSQDSQTTESLKDDQSSPGQDRIQAKLIAAEKKSILSSANANQWTEFSEHESLLLETAYEQFISKSSSSTPNLHLIQVGEDDMFEVDILQRLYYPIYWEGSASDVIRATWFVCDSSGKVLPVEELLSSQIEDGYHKFQPWKAFTEESFQSNTTSVPSNTSTSQADDFINQLSTENYTRPTVETIVHPSASSQASDTTSDSTKTSFKWSLFGPYSSNYVIYNGHSSAWIMSENVTAKLAQAIYFRFSSGENLGGLRIVRGYEIASRYSQKKKSSSSENMNPIHPEEDSKSSHLNLEPEMLVKKNVRHLVLATHGIGQKLGERSSVVNFIQDISNLRKNLKDNFVYLKQQTEKSQRSTGSVEALKPNTEDDGGIIVLPIEWRKKLRFDAQNKDKSELSNDSDQGMPSVQDITLDTVSGLRALISDVLLDVILYMEPHHRLDMIFSVIKEMNRVYRLFVKYHPDFIANGGKVHIFAHSLGSLICLDALSHFSRGRMEGRESIPNEQWAQLLASNQFSPVDLADLSISPDVRPSEDNNQSDNAKPQRNRENSSNSRGKRSSSNPIPPASVLFDGNKKEATRNMLISSVQSKSAPHLEFDVNSFFAVGSPNGLFLKVKERKLGMPYQVMIRCYSQWLGNEIQSDQTSELSKSQLLKARKWIEKLEQDDNVLHPEVENLYHIFHPSDLVAYRLEPLICRTLSQKKPEPIPAKGSSKSISLSIQIPVSFRWAESWMGYALGSITGIPLSSLKSGGNSSSGNGSSSQQSHIQHHQGKDETISTAAGGKRRVSDPAVSKQVVDTKRTASTAPVSPEMIMMTTLSPHNIHPQQYQHSQHHNNQVLPSPVDEYNPPRPKFNTEQILTMINPHGRIDFAIQERVLENQYLSAIQVHFAYWTNEDVGLFIVGELISQEGQERWKKDGKK